MGKRGVGGAKNEGVGADDIGPFSVCNNNVCMAPCLLFGKTVMRRGRAGIASSWCQLVKKVRSSTEQCTRLQRSIATSK